MDSIAKRRNYRCKHAENSGVFLISIFRRALEKIQQKQTIESQWPRKARRSYSWTTCSASCWIIWPRMTPVDSSSCWAEWGMLISWTTPGCRVWPTPASRETARRCSCSWTWWVHLPGNHRLGSKHEITAFFPTGCRHKPQSAWSWLYATAFRRSIGQYTCVPASFGCWHQAG